MTSPTASGPDPRDYRCSTCGNTRSRHIDDAHAFYSREEQSDTIARLTAAIAEATARAGEAEKVIEAARDKMIGESEALIGIVASKEARRLDAFYERGRSYGYSASAKLLVDALAALRTGGGR